MQTLIILLTVLESLLSTLEHKTLQSDLAITMAEQVSQPLTYTGSFVMCGDKFHLAMFDMEAAYDGNTLYIYNEGTDELVLSRPTEEELLEANPFRYAKALVKVCNLTERASKDGKHTIITFTPKNKTPNGIQRFVLRVKKEMTSDNKELLTPVSVEMKEGNKTTTLQLTNPRYITTTTIFTLNKPNAYINDLR